MHCGFICIAGIFNHSARSLPQEGARLSWNINFNHAENGGFFMNILASLFGNYSKRELKRIQPICDRVLMKEDTYKD